MELNHNKKQILLVGAGYMGTAYAQILKSLKIPFIPVDNSINSSEKFNKEIGIMPITGGIEKWIQNQKNIPKSAIIAVNVDKLGEVARLLIDKGVNKILIEKPGGLEINDIKKTTYKAKLKKTSVYVAYNRRFYSSTLKAIEIIKKDGGPLSVIFEFTEWGHLIEKSSQPLLKIKKQWLLVNSSHVIDLAFFLSGWPKKMMSHKSGALSWHPSGAIFGGSGTTNKNAVFSYHANWQSAGRWSVEIMTKKRRLIMKPLEKLFSQDRGSLEIKEIPINDNLDKKYKPGLYLQTKAFLSDKIENLVPIDEQLEHIKIYEAINFGKNYRR